MLLTIVDSRSKWIEAFAMEKSTVPVLLLFATLDKQFGIPETIVSDNGTQFVSAEFKEFCQLLYSLCMLFYWENTLVKARLSSLFYSHMRETCPYLDKQLVYVYSSLQTPCYIFSYYNICILYHHSTLNLHEVFTSE